MPAAYWKFCVDRGETWRTVLRLRNPADPITGVPGNAIDLTGYLARMQVRALVASAAPLVTLTTAVSGGITIDGVTGSMTIFVADEATAAWDWRYAVYDLEIESSSGDTTHLLKGEIEVSDEVTR